MKRLRPWSKAWLLLILIGCTSGFLARRVILQSLGGLLIVDDTLQSADLAVMTTEAQAAGAIDLADLFARHMATRVGALVPEPSPASLELRRRGVMTDNPDSLLAALGVPVESIDVIPAREGGTTDGATALAHWCATRSVRRLIVVTAPNHTHRVRRALRRAFGKSGPAVYLHGASLDPFRQSDWWKSRGTLRSGIVELQKLLLDYIQHPFSEFSAR